MIDAHVEREVILALNEPETEAIPLQRSGSGQDVLPPLFRRLLAVLGGGELDVVGVGQCAPNDPVGIVEFEPAAVRIVAAQVRIDHVRHGPNVAAPRNVPGGNRQAGHLRAAGRVLAIAPKMLGLLIAGRNVGHRCLGDLCQGGR
jgi:hypothetical protein